MKKYEKPVAERLELDPLQLIAYTDPNTASGQVGNEDEWDAKGNSVWEDLPDW